MCIRPINDWEMRSCDFSDDRQVYSDFCLDCPFYEFSNDDVFSEEFKKKQKNLKGGLHLLSR